MGETFFERKIFEKVYVIPLHLMTSRGPFSSEKGRENWPGSLERRKVVFKRVNLGQKSLSLKIDLTLELMGQLYS